MLLSSDNSIDSATTDSFSPATVKTGGVGGMLVLHWQITSVLAVLMVKPHPAVCPNSGLFNLLNKWAEKGNHWGFMGHTE